jgi:hypothetical protein
VLRSLEDHMKERQHHLNESSSARLRRSQKLEILPSPNSKSLGACFLMGAEISTSALFLLYIMWRSNFTIPHSFGAYLLDKRIYFGHAHIFWTCAYILNMCIYFEKMHTFWESAYILSKRLHFEQTPIFCVCVNILGKCQWLMIFCSKFCLVLFFAMSFCLILLLQIFVYIFSIYSCIFVCANIFGAIVLKPTLKKNSPTHVIKLAFATKTYPPWQYKNCKW